MEKSNKTDSLADRSRNAFWFIFFCIFPLVSIKSLLDYDFEPKTLVLSLLCLYLGFRSRNTLKLSVIKKNGVQFAAITLFILIAAFSLTKSINFYDSFVSFRNLLLPLLFFILIVLSDIINLKIIFRYAFISVFLLTIFLIIQIVTSLFSGEKFAIDNTLQSTLSNKNFLSESLILLLPFCICGYLWEKRRNRKLNFASIMIIIGEVIFLQSISSWICLILLFVSMPFYFMLIKNKNAEPNSGKRKKIVIALAFTAIVVTVAFAVNDNKRVNVIKIKMHSVKNYLTEGFDTNYDDKEENTNSIFERLFLWKNTIAIGNESPVIGSGIGNWKILWPKHGVGGAHFLSSGVMHYEHPHNEYLLFYSETGLVGVILFLVIIIFPLLYVSNLFRKAREHSSRQVLFFMSYAIISFLILSFFGYPFHRPFSAALVMVALAIILKVRNNQQESSAGNSFTGSKFIFITTIIICCLSIYISIQRINSEYYMRHAFEEQSRGRFKRMLTSVNAAEDTYFKIDLTGTPLDWYRGFAMNYMGSDSALYYFRLAETQNPYHVQVISDIGATLENKGKHEEAISYLKRALNIIPRYREAHYNLAIAYYNTKRPADALTEINQSYAVSDEYRIALEAILVMNAESLRDSLPMNESKIQLEKFISDIKVLKDIHKISMDRNLSFTRLLKDSCESKIAIN